MNGFSQDRCRFVEPNLCAVIARIEPAIQSGLGKEVNLRSDLRVQKECQTWVEKSVDVAVDKAGRGLFEVIDFQIERAAEARAKIIVKCSKCERVINPVEKIIGIESARCAGKNAQAESA